MMSKLQKLIQKLCPDGVEYKKLGEIGNFFGGLTGKSKDDFKDGNAKFITYRNVYANPSLNIDIKDKVKISDNEKQHIVRYGDILFTGSSETPDECGMSSIVTNQICDELYLNSFCFGLRLYKIEEFDLHYLKHVLRSSDIRKQIKKTASGVTRYNVSKKLFAKVCIPVPPIEIQTEIAHILDVFTNLAAELQAELQARQEQYEYYLDRLFNLKTEFVIYKLSDICTAIGDGLHGTPKYKDNGDYFFINGNNLVRGKITLNSQTKRIGYEEFCKYGLNFNSDTVFLSINGTIGNVALYNKEQIALGKSVAYFVINPLFLNVKFLCYYFKSKYARIYFESNSTGSTIKNLGLKALRNMAIQVPSLSEQQRIVSILDKFETLVNDLSQGLPAEITAVQEQYEYYRNKLLSFQKITKA